MTRSAGNVARHGNSMSRICVATRRNLARQAFHAALFEAEDVLASTGDVDLIEIQPGPTFQFKSKWQKRLLFRGIYPPLADMNPGLQRVPLIQDYELFVAVCLNIWDAVYFNSVVGWKDRCKVSICWLCEMWSADIPHIANLLRVLQKFDYVIIGCRGSVEALSERIGRQCYMVPPATDTLRFSPFPELPDRSIDVYSIGRRWEGVHRALEGAVADRKIFYIYDTFRGMAEMQFTDHAQHRNVLANIAKRTKFFMVSPAKMNAPGETMGQVEVGYRYFEGSAAGAAMIGQAADSPLFRDLFPWSDAVVEINPDGSDVMEKISELRATPERLAAINRRNAAESLIRHDWIHRWLDIFKIASVEPTTGMTARAARLRELAHAGLQASGKEPAF